MALRQLSRFSSLHTIRAATGVSFKVPLVGTACPFSDQAGGKSTKLWGGRFARDTDASLRRWIESVTVDSNLAVEDMWGSQAHVTMLGRQGIIPAEHAGKIISTLVQFQDDFIAGKWKLGEQQEDVHMNVEKRLIDTLGMDIGGRMHTCRSRNDQVVLDSKLYARNRLLELRERIVKAVDAFLRKAEGREEDVMVAYTHVQHAQPVSVAYWLTSYASHLIRDLKRLKAAYDVTDENPLGAGAIAGTSFPIDRQLTTDLLGFQRIHHHCLDATSARDFMLDVLNAAATLQILFSRLAEEFIMWSSYEFRTLTLDDGFAMGSSMMPQKKNPGALELMRGRAGRMTGYATAGYTMVKGLPSGYNRDFHEDKELLVLSMDMINKAAEVIPPLIDTTTINGKRMAELPFKQYSTATELANYLVSKHSVPFREAHHISGSLVGELYRAGEDFSTNRQKCYDHLREKGIKASNEEIDQVLDPKSVMLSYNSYGGTGKDAVVVIEKELRKALEEHEQVLQQDKERVQHAYKRTRAIAREGHTVKTVDDISRLLLSHR